MNVGTIGTGGITSWFLKCWQELGNSCYAMYSRTYNNADVLKKQFHGEKVYTDINLFLADEKIDVVYIASPNSLHFSHAKMALFAHKHVILEKPFTSTLNECEELISLAQEKKLFLMEGITVVDLPNLKLLPALIEEIAPIHMVVANMSKVSSKYPSYVKGEKPNVFQTAFSGGALMDLNVYHLHFMTTLFGMPLRLQYRANKKDGIDLSGCLTLTYDAFMAVCIAAKDSEAQNYVEIQGERGFIHIPSAAATTSSIDQNILGNVRTYQEQDHVLTHMYYLREFLKMVQTSDFEARDQRLAHTKDVMKLLVQARKDAGIVFEADR